MKKRTVLTALVLGFTVVFYAGAATDPVPADLQNNQYYQESIKYLNMAKDSFSSGDYLSSETYAQEAMKYASLSDDYVTTQIKRREAEGVFANAKTRLDWANSIGARTKFTAQFNQANTAYSDADKARTAEKWDDVITQSNKVIQAVAAIEDLNNQQTADAAIANAKARLDWATSIGAKTAFPAPYNQANTAFTEAGRARTAKKWADVTTQTNKVLAAVAEIEKLKAQQDALKAQQDALDRQKSQQSAAAIAKAKERLDWATSVEAQTYFPEPYGRANTAFTEAGTAQNNKQYDNALAAANRTIAAVAEIEKLQAQREAGATAAAAAAADLEAAERQRAEDEARRLAEEEARRRAEEEAARQQAADAEAARLRAAAEEAERQRAAAELAEAQRAATAAQAVAAAGERIEWALSVKADIQFPDAYNEATGAFDQAKSALDGKDWDRAIAQAAAVLKALEGVREVSPLPARYTVRTWQADRDCLWNIAAYPWVYNDPWQWRRLYDANRSKLPNEANPDLILPEMVLDIPSLRGESREGDWEPNRQYEPLP